MYSFLYQLDIIVGIGLLFRQINHEIVIWENREQYLNY